MTWFRRGAVPGPPPPEPEPEDSPAALYQRFSELVRLVNRCAGRLPVEAVVIARQVTDLIAQVLDSAGDEELDPHALVQVSSMIGDYLPTTLRAYLALDASGVEVVTAGGRTPRAALREQLEALRSAAAELLAAARAHDTDALFSQGSFLRTKFTGSDLDL